MAGPSLLKTILQFFSSSEAGLAADPTACEVASGADLWWGPESKRPRNRSGNEDPQAPSGCDGGTSSLPVPSTACLKAGDRHQVLWFSGEPACPTAPLFWDGARQQLPLKTLFEEPHAWCIPLPTPA